MLWNREDNTIPWQANLLQIFEPLSAHVPQYYQGTWKEAFDNSWSRKHLGVQDVEEHSTMFWSAAATLYSSLARCTNGPRVLSCSLQLQVHALWLAPQRCARGLTHAGPCCRSSVECTRLQLLARFKSRSYVAVLDPSKQAAVLQQLETLLDQHAELFHAPAPPQPAGDGWELQDHDVQPSLSQEPVVDVVLRTEVFVCVAS